MEEQIRAFLLADPGVSALAGSRVNYGLHPQGQPLPGVVLTVVSDLPVYVIEGPCGFSEARLQVDCYAETYGSARGLSRSVQSALSGYSSGNVLGAFLEGAQDSRDAGGGLTDIFRVRLQFQISYTV